MSGTSWDYSLVFEMPQLDDRPYEIGYGKDAYLESVGLWLAKIP
jgi:hypothetical protein